MLQVLAGSIRHVREAGWLLQRLTQKPAETRPPVDRNASSLAINLSLAAILFMTRDSLDKFQASKGWTAGVDASGTVLKLGVDGAVDTQTVQAPIVGFALTNEGLMANLSIEGSKFSKIVF